MGSDNKFCLKWNDYEQKITSSFRDIRRDSEFFDVTLCCNNGEDIIQAHKLILAACSPLLKKILNLQANQIQPFLYLKGVGIKELEAILNFMYYGEANVEQDLLDNFLTLAEELEVKGLTADTQPVPTPRIEKKTEKKSVKRPHVPPPPQPQVVDHQPKNSTPVKPPARKRPKSYDDSEIELHEPPMNDVTADDDYVDVEVEEFDEFSEYEQYEDG